MYVLRGPAENLCTVIFCIVSTCICDCKNLESHICRFFCQRMCNDSLLYLNSECEFYWLSIAHARAANLKTCVNAIVYYCTCVDCGYGFTQGCSLLWLCSSHSVTAISHITFTLHALTVCREYLEKVDSVDSVLYAILLSSVA